MSALIVWFLQGIVFKETEMKIPAESQKDFNYMWNADGQCLSGSQDRCLELQHDLRTDNSSLKDNHFY